MSNSGGNTGGGGVQNSAAIDAVAHGAEAGKDCTTALTTAIAEAVALGGGEVYFSKPGTYLLNGAQIKGTAEGYSYNGQIVFPAVAEATGRLCIKICGLLPAPRIFTGPEEPSTSGVTLLSNATEGSMFDAIPAYKSTNAFTNVDVTWENIILRAPNNPACGAINAAALISMETNNVLICVNAKGNEIHLPEHATKGLVTPRIGNGSRVRLSNTWIYGYEIGLDHAEHCYLDNVSVQWCVYAIRPHGGEFHMTQYVGVLIQRCPNLLYVDEATAAGGIINGVIDCEISPSEERSFSALKYIVRDPNSVLRGALSIYVQNVGSGAGWPVTFGVSGARGLSLSNPHYGMQLNKTTTPFDLFTRVIYINSVPGTTDQTQHPWDLVEGKTVSAAGEIKSGESAAVTQAVVAYYLRNSAGSRVVKTLLKTGSGSYNVQQVLNRTYKTGNYLYVKLSGGKVVIEKQVSGSPTVLAESEAGKVAAETEYELVSVISNPAGGKYVVTCYLGSTEVVKHELSTGDIEALEENANETRKQDGIRWSSDTTSIVKAFSVIPSST